MIYKFANPEPNEINDRFRIVEDRDDRVLVEDVSSVWDNGIRPTFVYLKSDLVEI